MKKLLIALLVLVLPISTQALDKKIGAANSFKIGIFDTVGNGITGLTYTTHYVAKVQCGSGSTVTIDGTGDTITGEGVGFYRITTNDTISPTNEDECLVWTEGAGSYIELIAKTPVKFKAVSATTSVTTCDISASTSGTSFTVATCVDDVGVSITLATDMFVGSYMVAYTNGASQCNVVGQGVFVNDLTAGVVTVKETDMPGSGFSATPNTSNCGIRIYP